MFVNILVAVLCFLLSIYFAPVLQNLAAVTKSVIRHDSAATEPTVRKITFESFGAKAKPAFPSICLSKTCGPI